MTEEPVLMLPDHSKPYKVETNASEYALGGGQSRKGT